MTFLDTLYKQIHMLTPVWWAIIAVAAVFLLAFRHKREQMAGNLLIVYLLFVLASTVLARTRVHEMSYRELMNLDLIGCWLERSRGASANHWELILNFVMLLPFGFLWPMATGRKLPGTLLLGFVLILVIELAQLLTRRGWFELCDIVDNTIGVLLGYGLYAVGKRLFSKIKARDNC